MADYFRTVQAAPIEAPGLGRLPRVKLSVPLLEGVPFAMVELDGAGKRRQTLRLDLDKRRFLDLPERPEYANMSAQIAGSIVDFLASASSAGVSRTVQRGKQVRPSFKLVGKIIVGKTKSTFVPIATEKGPEKVAEHGISSGGYTKEFQSWAKKTHIPLKKKHWRKDDIAPQSQH
jgi:hypothetical protein